MPLLAGVEAEDLEEEVKEIDDGIGIVEDGVGGLRSLGDEVGFATDLAFEVLEVEKGRGEDELGDEKVEELLLYFGVEQYFVGDVAEGQLAADVPNKPSLADQNVYTPQRHHVLALHLTPASHALLIGLPIPHLPQVLDQRDEDVLGVVLLEIGLMQGTT